MITANNTWLTFIAVLVVGMLGMAIFILTRRRGATSDTKIDRIGAMIETLGQSQQQLSGGLQQASETQSAALSHLRQTMDNRMNDVQQQMADRLHDSTMKTARALSDMQDRLKENLQGSSEKTTKSLTQLQERLATIDRAQTNIEKLSGDVLGLQDILSNKQARGAFGEIQLQDIVSKALAADAYDFQVTLSNATRVDCLIHLPNPPGPIAIDSKFPLEAYRDLVSAKSEAEKSAATRAFKVTVRKHIRDISEKYIIESETADGALMFLPSEAVYAELHANFGELVREGFDARVWVVSPTTCMATLNTMRAILKDARMREQAGAIRRELRSLDKDVERLVDRVGNLDRHFTQAGKDIEDIKISATKAGNRARKLDNFDFDNAPAIQTGETNDLVSLASESEGGKQ